MTVFGDFPAKFPYTWGDPPNTSGSVTIASYPKITPLVPTEVVKAAWDVIRAALDGAATPEFVEGPQMTLAKWVLDRAQG